MIRVALARIRERLELSIAVTPRRILGAFAGARAKIVRRDSPPVSASPGNRPK